MRFDTGRPVTDDAFVGRDEYIQDLYRCLENGNHTRITGIARIGKTSLVKEVIRRVETGEHEISSGKPFFFYYALTKSEMAGVQFFRGFLEQIREELKQEGSGKESGRQTIEAQITLCERQISGDTLENVSHMDIAKLVDLYYEMYRRRVWIVIDEMDYANDCFGIYIDKIREMAGATSNLCIMTVSRQELEKIMPKDSAGSNFPGIIPNGFRVKGYDKKDLELYIDHAKGLLDESHKDLKEKIMYYTGNVPILLSLAFSELEKFGECEDTDALFEEVCRKADGIMHYWSIYLAGQGLKGAACRLAQKEDVPEKYRKKLREMGFAEKDDNGDTVFTIPYFGEYLKEERADTDGGMLEGFLDLLDKIESLTQRGKDRLSVLSGDVTAENKLNDQLKILAAMQIKINAYKGISDKLRRVKDHPVVTALTEEELNAYKQTLNEISHDFGK